MISRQSSLLILLLLFSLLLSCNNKPDNKKIDAEKETALITEAIHNSIGWVKNKDLDLLYGIIANDSNFVEVHPDPGVVFGFDNFTKLSNFWMDPRFKAVGYEISNLKITLSETGNVAWFFCMLDDMNEWDGKPANWMNTRWTGVLEKRNGKWRTVQQHFSFATEN